MKPSTGTHRLLLAPLALLLALALILAGCGGDGNDDTSTAADDTTAATTVEANDDTTAAADEAEQGEGDTADQGEEDGKPAGDGDFVAELTAICEQASSEAEKAGLNDEFENDLSEDPQAFAKELVERWENAEDVFERAIDALRDVSPPAQLKQDYDRFIFTTAQVTKLTGDAMKAYAKDVNYTMDEKSMVKQQKLVEENSRLVRKLGLPGDCFSSSPAN